MEYVCGFLFESDFSEVVLIRKNKPDWQIGRLNGIGGHVESGENIIEAMTREFQEEANISVLEWKPICVLSTDQWRVHFYAQTMNEIKNALGDHREIEEGEIIVMPSTYHKDMIGNLQWLIPMSISILNNTCSENFYQIEVKQ